MKDLIKDLYKGFLYRNASPALEDGRYVFSCKDKNGIIFKANYNYIEMTNFLDNYLIIKSKE